MAVLFSGGEDFKELWNLIPTVKDYWNYIGLVNEIEDYWGDRLITEFDKRFLLDCLERYAQMKGISPE